MQKFELTSKQKEANELVASSATHCMLFGGSRSGKTFLTVRNIVLRALKAPNSRHAILRFRFNHIKSSIIYDTFPKVMSIAFPEVEWELNKTDWFAKLPNGSEIWFGGLDDKERVEKILGNEYVTIYLNECSQISYPSVQIVLTRLAQKVYVNVQGIEEKPLKPRMFYDCNPPSKGHWTYRLFIKKEDPDARTPLRNPSNYVSFQMNPKDNEENLSDEYLETLNSMSTKLRKRFLEGEFTDDNPNALFKDETFDKWRVEEVPQLIRVVVAVDPSGSEGDDGSDAIGIVVAGLGIDGNVYVLEDCTINAAPTVWGNVAVTAFDRHKADVVVGEVNYGGAMVKYVIQTSRAHTPFMQVTASRGKHVRAEPISVLYEDGKVRHVGYFKELEDELLDFSTTGFTGDKSPNRADALVWAISALIPRIINKKKEVVAASVQPITNKW